MIDLHMHTTYSDGTDNLEMLLKNAENKKLEIISITDHDSVDAYYELEKNSELRKLYSGEIIVGTELRTFYGNVPIEILAYGIDYKKLRIHKVDTEKMQKVNLNKFKNVANELGLKYDDKNTYIDIKDATKRWASQVMGTELLKYKENEEIIKSIGEFVPTSFYRVHQSNENSPFFINENESFIDINETISRIHEAGGLAFLAHGYVYPFKDKDAVIEEILSTTEIDGIESIHTLFSEEQRKNAINLCKKYNKFMSGGTDYHAKNKPDIEMGTGINNNVKIERNLIDNWIDKIKGKI